MNKLSDDDRQMLESLEQAIHQALDRKRRLGQYAVVWENGRPAYLGANSPSDPSSYTIEQPSRTFRVAEPD